MGKGIAPVFAPLGFGFWQAAVALLSGFVAKEAVVGTLTILYNPASDAAMYAALQSVFTPVAALAFLIFVLLYMPCVGRLLRHAAGDELMEVGGGRGGVSDRRGLDGSFMVYQFGTLAVNLAGLL